MSDHLPPAVRAAHDRLLDAWDALAKNILRCEGPAMEAKARREGATPAEAAQAAQKHVARLLIAMQRERAALEAEGARRH